MIDFVMNAKNTRMVLIRNACGGCALALDSIREMYISSSMHHSPTLHINVSGTVHHVYYDTQEEINDDVTAIVEKFLSPVATAQNPVPVMRDYAIHHVSTDRHGMDTHYLIDSWAIDSYGARPATNIELTLSGAFDEPATLYTHVLAVKDGDWETNIFGSEAEVKSLFARIQEMQTVALVQPFNHTC